MFFYFNLFMLFEKYTSESMSSVIVRWIKSSSGTLKLVQISHICMCVLFQMFCTRRLAEANAEGGA